MSGAEIIFEVTEDETGRRIFGHLALGFGIHTQGDTTDELHRNVREAVDCYFDDGMTRPRPDTAALCEGRGPCGVKLPRDVSGATLVAALGRMGYERVRQRTARMCASRRRNAANTMR